MATWGAWREPTFDEVLIAWERAKLALDNAKENEMTLRKKAFEMGFGANAHEGTNTETLGGGYELKGVKKFNYKLVAPVGKTIETAVENVVKEMTRISNEGSFLADRLFQWSVSMSVPEYKLLVESAQMGDPGIGMELLNVVNTVVLITDAAPTLEIKAPKKGK